MLDKTINNKSFFLLIIILLFVSFKTNSELINYVGSSTIGNFIRDAAKFYPAAKITVDDGPESIGGSHWIERGKSKLGGVAQDIPSEYKRKGVVGTIIGIDYLGILVNKKNPIKKLSMDVPRGRPKIT